MGCVADEEARLLGFVRRNGIFTISELKRAGGRLHPYLRHFKKWSIARDTAHLISRPAFTAKYLRKLIVTSGLVTTRKYQRFRNRNPTICPSLKALKGVVGINFQAFVKETLESEPAFRLRNLIQAAARDGGVLTAKTFGKNGAPDRKALKKFSMHELREIVGWISAYEAGKFQVRYRGRPRKKPYVKGEQP